MTDTDNPAPRRFTAMRVRAALTLFASGDPAPFFNTAREIGLEAVLAECPPDIASSIRTKLAEAKQVRAAEASERRQRKAARKAEADRLAGIEKARRQAVARRRAEAQRAADERARQEAIRASWAEVHAELRNV